MKRLVGCIVVGSFFLQGWGAVLVRDGQALMPVVIPEDALPVEQLAAREFIDHVWQITGVRLPKQTTVDEGALAIRLGRSAKLDTASLPPCSARVVVDDRGLSIAGCDKGGDPLDRTVEAGTLFGVYDFLENDLGVRWLWPGKLGTMTPKSRTLEIAAQNRIVHPMAFSEWRTNPEGEWAWADKKNGERFAIKQALWLRRHRFSRVGKLSKGHAYTGYYRRFAKDHPEYFNVLPDGSRVSDPFYMGGHQHFISMCVTEPTFVSRVIDEWRPHAGEDEFINANENDTSGKCCCARCLKADGTGDDAGRLARAREKFAAKDRSWVGELGSTSARYAAFYKTLLEEGSKVRPDCCVIGGIYANYSEPPPEGTQLGDRVVLRYCPPIMYPWTEKKVADFKRIWDGWSKTGARLMNRPNFMLDGHNFPLVFYRWYVQCFDFAYTHGLCSMDSDSLTGQYGANGLTLYVVAAKNGRPTARLEDLENDYFSAFGPAAEKIRAYMAFFEDVSNRGGAAPKGTPENMEGGFWANFFTFAGKLFTPEVMERGFALLDEADALVEKESVYHDRIDFLRVGLTDCNLVLKAQRGEVRLQKEGVEDAFASAYRELIAFRADHEHLGYSSRGNLDYLEGRLWPRHLGLIGENARKLTGWTMRIDGETESRPVELTKYPLDDKGQLLRKPLFYQTTFDVPSKDVKGAAKLIFGAIDGEPCVELNGQVILTKKPSLGRLMDRTPFVVDVTGKLVAEGNVLTISVENGEGVRGIHRPIYLETAGSLQL